MLKIENTYDYFNKNLSNLYKNKKYKNLTEYVDECKFMIINYIDGKYDPGEVLDTLEYGSTILEKFKEDDIENKKNLNSIFELGTLLGYIELAASITSDNIHNNYIIKLYNDCSNKKFLNDIIKTIYKFNRISHRNLAKELRISENDLSYFLEERFPIPKEFINIYKYRLIENKKRVEYTLTDYGIRLYHILQSNFSKAEWIPVSYSLPTDQNFVRVTIKESIIINTLHEEYSKYTALGFYDDSKKQWYIRKDVGIVTIADFNNWGYKPLIKIDKDTQIESEVIAWQKLSEAYNGDEKMEGL